MLHMKNTDEFVEKVEEQEEEKNKST